MQLGINKLLVPSNEAIAFQGASPLATELTMIFQDVIDLRIKLIQEGDPKTVDKVLEYHKKTIPNKFRDIVKKHTGLDVGRFETSKSPTLCYACMLKFGEGDTGWSLAHDAIERYSGQGPVHADQIPATEEELQKTYQEISKLIDLESGKLKSTKFKFRGKITYLRYDVFFCAHSAYMAKQTLGDNAEEYTAAEVTAIMLHEIGHMMSLIEHSGDLLRSLQSLTAKVNHSGIKDPDHQKMSQALSTAASVVKKFKADDKALDIELKRIAASADSISELPKESNIVARFLGVIRALTKCSFNIMLASIESIVVHVLMPIYSGSVYVPELLASFKNKTSDFMMTYGDRAICERYSDEYVAQHGFSAHYVTGSAKYESHVPLLSLGGSGRPGMRESVIVYYIGKFHIFVVGMLTAMDTTGYGTYEKELVRYESLLHDILKVFKTTNLPPELVDFYVTDYEETMKAVAHARKMSGVKGKLQEINVFLTQTVSFPHLVKLLTTGNIDTKYQQLMDAVKNINSSVLYYWSSKLDQLARK